MHICFLALDYPSNLSGGGVGTQTQTLANALVAEGHKVSVIALGNVVHPTMILDGNIEVWSFNHPNIHWYFGKIPVLGGLFSLFLREMERSWVSWTVIRQIDKKEPIDIVEITETGGLFAALLPGNTKVVARLHGEQYTFRKHTQGLSLGTDYKILRWLQRLALQHVCTYISPSSAHAEEIASELNIPIDHISVIPNMVVIPEIAVRNLGNHAPSVLFAGRIELGKGVWDLVNAAGYVKDVIPNVRFYLAGSQHPTLNIDKLNLEITRQSLTETVVLLGHIPHTKLDETLGKTDIFVLPSYYETFGLAVLEAMSYGLPVVATHVGGLPELVENGVSGCLVPPGKPQELAKVIVHLLQNRDLALNFGRAARERAWKFYDYRVVVSKNLQLYFELIEKPLRP